MVSLAPATPGPLEFSNYDIDVQYIDTDNSPLICRDMNTEDDGLGTGSLLVLALGQWLNLDQ